MDALVLIAMTGATSSVLPMCHVHVSIVALGCEATYISVIPKIPKKIGHSLLSKSLPHDNIQLHLPGKSSLTNFQSFCSARTVVKEVLARHILMS